MIDFFALPRTFTQGLMNEFTEAERAMLGQICANEASTRGRYFLEHVAAPLTQLRMGFGSGGHFLGELAFQFQYRPDANPDKIIHPQRQGWPPSEPGVKWFYCTGKGIVKAVARVCSPAEFQTMADVLGSTRAAVDTLVPEESERWVY